MKIKKVIGVMLLPALMLCGCAHNPQIVYKIGEEFRFGRVTTKLEIDEVRERLVLYYDIAEEANEVRFFSFTYTYNSRSWSNNEQFEYSDSLGSEIEFDENGYYNFYTSRIFYVSYQNADPDIKRAISEKKGSYEFPIATFAFWEDVT